MQSTLTKRNWMLARWGGLLMIFIGIAGWWYNRELAATAGHFYIKLCIIGPLGVFGGLLMIVRPEWAGPLRRDSPRAHNVSLFAVIGLIMVTSGFEMFHLSRSAARKVTYTRLTPAMGTPVGLRMPAQAQTPATDMTFLGRTYRLASFNQKANATWEFVPAGENIEDWKTLLTVVDRPDARTREQIDRLAEGIMSNYKSHGGRVLMAKTMQQSSGAPYNYMVVAFEQPAQQRYELNFVKIAQGRENAVVTIYGAHVGGSADYVGKAKAFLDQDSGEIGRALSTAVLPEISRMPRRVF